MAVLRAASDGLALIDVTLLWLSLVAIIVLFWGMQPFAAMPLIPYVSRVTIASVLNLRMLQMNRPAQRV